ncbi:MAG: protein-L-isoaspartate(D-aspartate) O-methyltransferase [Prolixibacteraceae bacterium]|jgi:protein-L-isoaspartate(D-aspartate) O-methyltransferase|nr:protein-L-isoaspartate(D-aspartate) O-methyltransferase [Prolixibacteraceae bacterium]MDD4754972.1 protein-L-isoaspartate(D-aspartate) O-methyltransferase [Prolixibacteraceae bacterium]
MRRDLYYCLFLFIIIIPVVSCGQSDTSFVRLRQRMVKTQIEARGITDKKVLDAVLKVERHKFVLPRHIAFAYNDSPLPIEEGQTISQPYIVAFMTEALNLKSNDKVLEIGTGSGYQAAILAEICDSVFTVEIFEKLGTRAERLFMKLGYNNIHCLIGDGYQGWPDHAPYDAIIVTCAPEKIPEPLLDQLAEGGRMIIPVGDDPVQHLVLLIKRNGRIRERNILPVRFVPMVSPDGKRY